MAGTKTRARLTYSAGNEHNPADPFGRSELAIDPDGRARLDHYQFGRQRTWTGIVEPAAVDRLWAALDRAGFPNTPSHPVPPDSTIRMLAAETGGTRQTACIAWYAATSLPGYDEAFTILDAIVRQLSEDTVPWTLDTQPPLVTVIKCGEPPEPSAT